MPRASAEARSAASYRAGGKPPSPPKGLNKEAAAMWRGIVSCKPIGWFDQGSLPILESYCVAAVRAREIELILNITNIDDPVAGKLESRLIALNANCTTMATKLRLSVQAAVDRRNRILDEQVDQESETQDAPLLGGKAVWPGLKVVA